MKRRIFSGTIILVLICSGITFADRPLERAEILQIFEQLTSCPRKTWIPACTIEATHQEYKAAAITDANEINRRIAGEIQNYQGDLNKRELTEELQKMKLDAIPFNVRYELFNEYTMNSTVLLKFDGNRFYWEINVDSRTDSLKPRKDLTDNFMTEQFDLGANKRRIFAWDGQTYTTYFLPGNNATVDARVETPHAINGPLTAGLVPWGYGHYSYSNLCAAESTGVETTVDNQIRIDLTVREADGSEYHFLLDPIRAYALISCSITRSDGSISSRHYSDYEYISNRWVPKTILIEQLEAGSGRLMARDLWNLTTIDGNIPQTDTFDVPYESDALIEYFSDGSTRPVMYRHSNTVDTKRLLAERQVLVDSDGTQVRNCATIALKYVSSELGASIAEEDLASLVNQANGTTSLYDMKYFMQGYGLYCRAVKTDIKTITNLTGCKAILHIPGKNHFVVVERIDDQNVWTIDLSDDRFYYRTDIGFFDMDWTEGTALLVSNQPINGEFNEISDNNSINITGGAGYSCTKLLQTYNVIFCSEVGGLCGGCYYVYYTRYGCEAAESGSCSTSMLVRYKKTPCIDDPEVPGACTGTGVWTSYYMKACN